MACQYCGGEIGPLRILRDQEFCSSAHRKRYQDRLNRALGQADVANLRPKKLAGFQKGPKPKGGVPRSTSSLVPISWRFDSDGTPVPFTLDIPPVIGRTFRSLTPAERRARAAVLAPTQTPILQLSAVRFPGAAFEILSELPTPEPAPPVPPPPGKTKRLGVGIANLKSKPKPPNPILDGIRAVLPVVLDPYQSLPVLQAADSPRPVNAPLPAIPASCGFVAPILSGAASVPALRFPQLDALEPARAALPGTASRKVKGPQPAAPSPIASQAPEPLAATAAPQLLLPATPGNFQPKMAALVPAPREDAAAPLPAATAPNGPRIAASLALAELAPALCLPVVDTPELAGVGLCTTGALQVNRPTATAPASPRIAASQGPLAEATLHFRLPALDTPEPVSAALRAGGSLPVNVPRPAQAIPQTSHLPAPLLAAVAPALLPCAPADFQPELPASLIPPPREIPTTLLPVAAERSASRVAASLEPRREFAPAVCLPTPDTLESFAAALSASGSLATKLPKPHLCAISGGVGVEPIPPSHRDASIPSELPAHSRSALMLRPGATRVIALPPNPGSLDAAARIAQALAQKPSSPRQPDLPVEPNNPTLSAASAALPLPEALAPAAPARIAPGATATASKPPITAPELPVASIAARPSLASGAPIAIAAQSTAGKASLVRDAQPIASPAPRAGAAPSTLRAMAAEFPFTPVPSDAVLAGEVYDFVNDPPPQADFVPVDYHCHRTVSHVHTPMEWLSSPSTQNLPRPPFHAVLGTLSGLLPASNTTYFAKQTKRPRNWRALEMAAAIGAIAVFLGAGMTVVGNFIKDAPDVRRELASSSDGPSTSRGWTRPEVRTLNPFTAIHRVIANRAAVELGDSFQAGMEAWGHVKSLAPGWTRNSAGWVEPGQLAFFKPSMKFTDYRMEFYGQIESRSMDWVVRGTDPKNYYAMKFTYLEQGLRPIIAMVHYPVINGKAGRRSTTPLNVMVHNREAYHVDVAVNGNHIITSIEGQEVDRWIEDALPAGGVGFFAEAGERARIYWMKVAKNEDFLGKICALIGGNSSASRDTAFLFSPQAFYQGINPNYGNDYFTATGYGN